LKDKERGNMEKGDKVKGDKVKGEKERKYHLILIKYCRNG